MTLLTLACLAVGFAVLVLTFFGGDRLGRSRSRTPEPSPVRQIPPDPFRTTPYVPDRGLIPRYILAIICGAIGCVLMLDRSQWSSWIGLLFSLIGIYHGSAQTIELTGVRLYKRAAVAAVGLILAATAGTFHIWMNRGIAPY
jgi:hypothetical protein